MSGSTYSAPIDFRIPSSAPSNLDPAVRNALEEVYISLNLIARGLVNYAGIGPQVASSWPLLKSSTRTILSGNLRRFYAEAAEPMTVYQIVSFYDNGGELAMQLADATDNTKVAVGYCNMPGGLAAGEVGEFILGTGVPAFAGLTIGAHYWLSTTPGAISTVPAVAPGNVEQYLGSAISLTQLNFSASGFIQH